jgi:16S rRNA (cytidine1402-2'-O)-methyltransferase
MTAIARLEQLAGERGQRQAPIETPYRNNQMLAALTQARAPDRLLCVAADVTLPTEWVRTTTIAQ